MIFTPVPLNGACIIDLERFEDMRGFFSRAWSDREFEAQGINGKFVESNVSFSRKKGTLRGMHYQQHPNEQIKLVRCTAGAIYDVIIDLRPDSPTYMKHFAVELSAATRRMLYVPGEFAHGFQTLEDDTEVFYMVSNYYAPQHAGGVRYNDPAFGIQWPVQEFILIERDLTYPDYTPLSR
jgi:dTDP-4-dehydrorhamnose 3,5-epimerase